MAVEQIGTNQPDGFTIAGTYTSSATTQTLTYDGNKLLNLACTCASTDGSTSFEPVLFTTTMTGAGQVGGRVKCDLTINAAAGGWSNALKSNVTYGTSGRTNGLGSSACLEMTLSAGTTQGNYAPLEIELNLGSGAETGTCTSLMYLSVNGDDATTFQAKGYIMNLQGLGSATATEVFDECTDGATHALRILIGSTPYYILLTNNVDG
jgi:hypothetical protein